MNFFYYITIFFILCSVGVLPFFRQTKKNLMWFVLIVIFISSLLIIDLGIEFLAFSYLLIYIGAIAVMFLFVIVTVDPKFENQKDTFEKMIIPAMTLNNFLTFITYFCVTSSSILKGPSSRFSVYTLKNEVSDFFFDYQKWLSTVRAPSYHYKINRIAESHNYILENWFKGRTSFYSLLDYRLKDVHVFADNFFNEHGILLVIIGFILTLAMVVSVIIAKDCSIKNKN